jgi:hypothetical protein
LCLANVNGKRGAFVPDESLLCKAHQYGPPMCHPWTEVAKLIEDEAVAAESKFGDFASMHEAYGVLAEEVAELFEAIRLKQDDVGTRRPTQIRAEAIQVAAVALRIAEQAGRVTR